MEGCYFVWWNAVRDSRMKLDRVVEQSEKQPPQCGAQVWCHKACLFLRGSVLSALIVHLFVYMYLL